MTDLLTVDGHGQRAESFRFELLDRFNSFLGDITVDATSAPSITNNINRTVKRQMSGLVLPPSVTADINTLTERVRPWMRFEDGQEYPLGVFLFADASRRLASSGSVDLSFVGDAYTTEGACLDQLITLNQANRGINFYGPGHSIYDALQQQLDAAGVIDYQIDATDATIADWVVWKSDATRLQIINDLAAMAGFYSLYFDNHGTAILRKVPAMEAVEPVLMYDAGRNVYADSIVESDDQLDAPNVYLVTNSGFTSGPIWGEWQLPASAPHSYDNRGFWVVSSHDVQGVESNAQARAMAKAIGQADYQTYRWVNLDSAIDPRHDTFDVAGWKGDKYREQGWGFTLQAGAGQSHEFRRVWNDDIADLIEEEAA
jgi:hypothetical protein